MELKVLQWEGYVDRAKVESFKSKIKSEMGINLNFSLEKMVDEKVFFNQARAHSVDMIFPGVDIVVDPSFQFKEKGLVIPLDSNSIPHFKDLDSELQKPQQLIYNHKLYGVPFAMGQLALYYNTDKIKDDDIKDIKSFLKKAKPGSIGTINFAPHTIYILAMALGYKKSEITNFDKLSKDKEFLEVLSLWRKKATVVFNSGVDTIDKTKNIDAFISWGFTLRELEMKYHQNWKALNCKHGSITWLDSIMVTSRVKNNRRKLDVIYKFIDYLISKDYQEEIVLKKLSCLPVNRKAKENPSSFNGLTYLLNLDKRKNKFYLPALKDRRTRNGFQYLWKKALQ